MDDALLAGDALLSAWLSLDSTLWNTRLVVELTYNEAHVLGILYRHREDEVPMTATDLTRRTHLLKSQMNRVLTGLEQAGRIVRTQAESDKRLRYITLTPSGEAAYLRERERANDFIAPLIARIGIERANGLAAQMREVSDALEDILHTQAPHRHTPSRMREERTDP